jgi:hypothetical protein
MHAVADGEKDTVCGVDVASLHDFPDVPWHNARPVRCLLCRRWVAEELGDDLRM